MVTVTIPFHLLLEGIHSIPLFPTVELNGIDKEDRLRKVIVEGSCPRRVSFEIWADKAKLSNVATGKFKGTAAMEINPGGDMPYSLNGLKLRITGTVLLERLKLQFATGKNVSAPTFSERASQLAFRSYDASLPVFFFHIPKCGGISMRGMFEEWFRGRSYYHYMNLRSWRKPRRRSLGASSVLCGHFSRFDQTSAED